METSFFRFNKKQKLKNINKILNLLENKLIVKEKLKSIKISKLCF